MRLLPGVDWSAIKSWSLFELWRYSASSTTRLERAVRKGMPLADFEALRKGSIPQAPQSVMPG
jgi:hypothetical protein